MTTDVIARLRLMHKPRTERPGSCCIQCGIVWPCPTSKVLDEADAVPADAGIRDRIAQALADEDARHWGHDHDFESQYGGDPETDGFVNAVLAVFPAPADRAAEAEVWTVGREGEPIYGHFAIEVDAKLAAIECWREAETPGIKFVYSWQQDGSRLELLADGNCTGVLVSRDDVHGAAPTPPADRAAVLREAADLADHEAAFLYDDMGQKAAAGARHVADLLRRLADEAQQPEGEAHPATRRWAVEMYDPSADEWVSGMHYADRDRAVERLAQQVALAPLWADGEPVQRRLVRETTTYTIQAEGAQR